VKWLGKDPDGVPMYHAEVNPVAPGADKHMARLVPINNAQRPEYIDKFHNLAKMGLADRYGGTFGQIPQFDVLSVDISDFPILGGLNPATRVWMVYRVKEG
jgi:hypothetical protein